LIIFLYCIFNQMASKKSTNASPTQTSFKSRSSVEDLEPPPTEQNTKENQAAQHSTNSTAAAAAAAASRPLTGKKYAAALLT
jgi:hypothetical protein